MGMYESNQLPFTSEIDLRDAFWRGYKRNPSILRGQFESEARKGGIDLLTVEDAGSHYEINAFEFKLDDMKKLISQAKDNLRHAHKSWMVIPRSKARVLTEKYADFCKDQSLGIIAVDHPSAGGRYSILKKPAPRNDEAVIFSQQVMELCLGGEKKGRRK